MKCTYHTSNESNVFGLPHSSTVRIIFAGLFLLLSSVSIITTGTCDDVADYMETPFQNGEVLYYSVKWSGIKLGTVEISQVTLATSDSSEYLLTLTIKSDPKIPFTDIFIVDRSILSPVSPTNIHFEQETGEDGAKKIIYEYDREKGSIRMISLKNENIKRQKTMPYTEPFYDCLGVIMMIRCLSQSNSKVSLPTLSDFKLKKLDLRFTDARDEIEVACMDIPVQARRFEGSARWAEESSVGLKGSFDGWISDDNAAVPLKARVKVIVGSVNLELERIERYGWTLDGGTDKLSNAIDAEEREQ